MAMDMIDKFKELASIAQTLGEDQVGFLRQVIQVMEELFVEDEERTNKLKLIKLALEEPDQVLKICNYLDMVCMPKN